MSGIFLPNIFQEYFKKKHLKKFVESGQLCTLAPLPFGKETLQLYSYVIFSCNNYFFKFCRLLLVLKTYVTCIYLVYMTTTNYPHCYQFDSKWFYNVWHYGLCQKLLALKHGLFWLLLLILPWFSSFHRLFHFFLGSKK